MKFPLKQQILLSVTMLISTFTFSQKLMNENYSLYLTNIIENETTFDKKMKISHSSQYYYEGEIEVRYEDFRDTKKYNFFFSIWNGNYKEFIVKDLSYNNVSPKIYFKNKNFAFFKNLGKEKIKKLMDSSMIEKAILSSMIIWLDENES